MSFRGFASKSHVKNNMKMASWLLPWAASLMAGAYRAGWPSAGVDGHPICLLARWRTDGGKAGRSASWLPWLTTRPTSCELNLFFSFFFRGLVRGLIVFAILYSKIALFFSGVWSCPPAWPASGSHLPDSLAGQWSGPQAGWLLTGQPKSYLAAQLAATQLSGQPA